MTTRIPRRLLGATVTIASSALALVLPSGAFGQGGTIPPLQKVDTNGTQIEGASWQFESCTRYNNEPDWTCIQGSDYGPLPKIGWTDWIGREIDTEGGGGPNLIQVITVWETEAPAGYALDSTPVSYTAGCNGWRRGVPPADYPGRDRSPRWEGQPTVDCDSDPMGPDEPMRLVNEPIMVPVLQNQMPLLQKLDQDNRPLLGAVATGHSCTRWDSDLNWQCQSLDDYPAIDPQANSTFLRDDIASRFPTTPTTPLLGLTSHRLIMWEKSAPAGYSTTPRTYAVEYACGAWRTLEVSGRSADDLTGASTATCDSPVLADNTFTWVNARIPTTTVPQTSGAQGTPVASVPAGAPVTSTPATVTTPPPGPGSSASGLAQATRLAITKTGPRRVRAGARVTYVIRVRNAGQVPARRVVIADTVPASMALAAVPRGVVLRGGRVVLNAGTLAPGARRVVRLTFVLDGGARGVRTNVATAVAANARRVSARSRAAIVAVRHTAVRPARPAVTG